jgi:hypothetical protein
LLQLLLLKTFSDNFDFDFDFNFVFDFDFDFNFDFNVDFDFDFDFDFNYIVNKKYINLLQLLLLKTFSDNFPTPAGSICHFLNFPPRMWCVTSLRVCLFVCTRPGGTRDRFIFNIHFQTA